MNKSAITFWRFLWDNLSVIKLCGLILLLSHSIITLGFIGNSIYELIISKYTLGTVQENIVYTHTCYSGRRHHEYSCTDHNSIISYFDTNGETKSFQSGLIENQSIGRNFVVVYGGALESTLVERLLILWLQVFILFTIMPVYLMIYHAYKKTRAIYKKGIIFWILIMCFSMFVGGSVWSYFVGSPFISLGSFILGAYIIYRIFNSYKKV